MEEKKKFKVLICIDDSQWSNAAFEFYAENLHQEGNDVVCFHCIHPPFFPGDASHVNPHVYQAAAREAVAKAEDLEKRFAVKMKNAKVPGTITARLTHEPGHEILKKAEEDKSNLIVLGTRGQGTVKRTILGSISHHVLHHAHCPVFIYTHHHDHHHKTSPKNSPKDPSKDQTVHL